ncbi:MAG: hypothetical protein Q8Q78_14325 [Hydrogenophaga sp.]|nr:hypothetical protein [Hydrogenophaga sp.]
MRPDVIALPNVSALKDSARCSGLTDDHIWLWEAYSLAGGLARLDVLLWEVSNADLCHKIVNLEAQVRSGQLVKVSLDEHVWLPRFQFARNYSMFPAVPRAIACLPARFSELDVALWFCSSNHWLEYQAPMDIAEFAGESLVAAAQAQNFERTFSWQGSAGQK